MSPTSPIRVPGALLITPRDPCSQPGQGPSHNSPCKWESVWPKVKGQRQLRQRLPGWEEEHDDYIQSQPLQQTLPWTRSPESTFQLSRKDPLSPHIPPEGWFSHCPCVQRDQLGLREVERDSCDSSGNGANSPVCHRRREVLTL